MAWYDLDEIKKNRVIIDTVDADGLRKSEVLENKKEKILKRDKKLYITFMERQYVRVSVLENIIRLPRKGELLRLVTQQNFNAFALFLFVLKREEVESVYFTTYSIDRHTIVGIESILKNNKGIKITLLIASLIKHDKPILRERMKSLAYKYKGCRFLEAYNHTKLIAVKTKRNWYVIEGSGNLSANARIESYLFDNNKDSYDFHKNWIEEIINKVKGTEVLQSKNCIIIK